MEEKNTATLIAIGEVGLIIIGTLIYCAVAGIQVDSEIIKMGITGLLGFAAGGVTTVIKDKI